MTRIVEWLEKNREEPEEGMSKSNTWRYGAIKHLAPMVNVHKKCTNFIQILAVVILDRRKAGQVIISVLTSCCQKLHILFAWGGVKTEALSALHWGYVHACLCRGTYFRCEHIFCVYTLDGCVCSHVFVCAYKHFQYGWYAKDALVVGDKAVAQELALLLLSSTAHFTVNFYFTSSLNEWVYCLVSYSTS